MMILWVVIEAMFLFLFFELPSAPDNDADAEKTINASAADTGRIPRPPNSSARAVGSSPPAPSCPDAAIEVNSQEAVSTCSSGYHENDASDDGLRQHERNSVLKIETEPFADAVADEKTPLLLARGGIQVSGYSSSSFPPSDSPPNDSASCSKADLAGREVAHRRQCSGWSFVHRLLAIPRHFCRLVWELVREETVVLLGVVFMTMFNQTAIEVRSAGVVDADSLSCACELLVNNRSSWASLILTFDLQALVVPIAEDLLDWHEKETSIFYSVAGVEVHTYIHSYAAAVM